MRQGGMGSDSTRFRQGEAVQQLPIVMLAMRAMVTGWAAQVALPITTRWGTRQ